MRLLARPHAVLPPTSPPSFSTTPSTASTATPSSSSPTCSPPPSNPTPSPSPPSRPALWAPSVLLHTCSLKIAFHPTLTSAAALLDGYARSGDMIPQDEAPLLQCHDHLLPSMGYLNRARQLFDELDERDFACCKTMVDGYNQLVFGVRASVA